MYWKQATKGKFFLVTCDPLFSTGAIAKLENATIHIADEKIGPRANSPLNK